MIFASSTRRWALCLWSIALCCTLAGCSARKVEAFPGGAKVLVVGDSITAAYGLDPQQSWTTTLAAETGWQVINAGVSGDTTSSGAERLPALLDEHQPLAVIIALGGNDMLRRAATATISANLEAMLAEISRRGARPILMSIPQPSVAGAVFGLSDAPLYAAIAKEKKLVLIDGVIAQVLAKPELRLDEIHPNGTGQERIGKEAASALRKQGLVR